MNRKHYTKNFIILGTIAFLLIIPLLSSDPYHLQVLMVLLLNIILAISLWVIMTVGQLSLAHAAFMAVGAYTSALLVMKLGLPFWLAMPASGIMAAILALVIGSITLRLKGAYFLLVTFAFGEIVILIFSNFWESLFGGVSGLIGVPPPDPISIPFIPQVRFVSKVPLYYLALSLTLITVLTIYRLKNSRLGLTFGALKEGDLLAECIGIDIMKYKVMAFTVGCFFAGIAGSLYAHSFVVVTPIDFSFYHSVYILIYVVVGGESSFLGPILGASVLTLFSEILRKFGHYESIGYGIALILVMLFLPSGIISLLERIIVKVQELFKRIKG
ncbi:MAG: branched-chain amino acid ABC transporter permease [Desulfobacterales bacterium]|nr:branched-chain amino acid ABC transporter permease [Desulfobacterales bacterium]